MLKASFLGLLFMGVLSVFFTACGHRATEDTQATITLSAPRDFAYVIGSTIEHTLKVHPQSGQTLDSTGIPSPGAINDWLIIRSVDLASTPTDAEDNYVVRISYQIFKGVRRPEQAVIPPVKLHLSGQKPQELESPAWSFTLVPVIPPDESDDVLTVREPQAHPAISSASELRKLYVWLSAVVGVTLLFGLRQVLRQRRNQPFASACRQLKSTLTTQPEQEALCEGVRIIHRALDQTFGETLFKSHLDQFCRKHPSFATIEDQLKVFFSLSQQLFFDPSHKIAVESSTKKWLSDLAQRCLAAERKAGL